MEQRGGLRRWGTAGPQAETERHSPALPVRLISFRVKNPARGGSSRGQGPQRSDSHPTEPPLTEQAGVSEHSLHWLS